jgi:hypothetical protein
MAKELLVRLQIKLIMNRVLQGPVVLTNCLVLVVRAQRMTLVVAVPMVVKVLLELFGEREERTLQLTQETYNESVYKSRR